MTRLRFRRRSDRRERTRGQGLVEFALVVPIIILVVVSVAELGLAFGNAHTIGYGSREGARVGSALAKGGATNCNVDDPALVDANLVGAIQRILNAPGSGIDISKVQEILIYKATSSGGLTPGRVNRWLYTGPLSGPDIDPGPGTERIDFNRSGSSAWPACMRVNSGANPDSIGVTVKYRYDFVTPLPSVANAITGGDLFLNLSETTVMALNPSV